MASVPAAQVWAQRVRLGQDAVNHAAEVKLRAERRAGELLADVVKMGSPIQVSDMTTLDDLGVTRDQSSQWQLLAQIPEETFPCGAGRTAGTGDARCRR